MSRFDTIPFPALPALETARNEIRCRNPIRPMIPPRAAEVFDGSGIGIWFSGPGAERLLAGLVSERKRTFDQLFRSLQNPRAAVNAVWASLATAAQSPPCSQPANSLPMPPPMFAAPAPPAKYKQPAPSSHALEKAEQAKGGRHPTDGTRQRQPFRFFGFFAGQCGAKRPGKPRIFNLI